MNEHSWYQASLLAIVLPLVFSGLWIAKRSRSGITKIRVLTLGFSVAFFVIVTWTTTVDPAGAAKVREAFGQRPLGLPSQVVIPLLVLIVGIPVPFLVRDVMISILLETGAMSVEELPQGYVHSLAMARWIVGYLVLLMIIWIIYCDLSGI